MQRNLKFLHQRNRMVRVYTVMILIMVVGIGEYQPPDNTSINVGPRIKASETPTMAEIYVSPSGNDSADGSLSTPLQTVAAAQGLVRDLTSSMTGNIIVYLRGGVYFLEDGLTFNQSDGGEGSFNVIYRKYLDEVPIISGGKSITGWTQNSSKVWSAPCNLSDFRQLYIEKVRGVRARGEPGFIKDTTGDGHYLSDTSFKNWKNFQDIEFVYQDIWTLPRVHPFMVKDDLLYMQQPAFSWTRYKPDSQNKAPVWIENAFELLDEPGEFYFDKPAKRVYYIPRNGEILGEVEVIAPNVEQMVNISGSPEDKLHNIAFQGITFSHGNWVQPNEFGTGFVEVQANTYRVLGPTQWDRVMSSGNIYASYATNIVFENCSFSYLGTTGLDLRFGIEDSCITGCKFTEIAGIALQVGDTRNRSQSDPTAPQTMDNLLIKNNYITNCSLDYMSGPGIFAGYIRNTRIEHNSISNLPYTGISLGWGWSAEETIAANNSVKYNHIYGVMNFLKDGGGIYTLSTSPGTNISYNVIHDSGWNGLYPDERTNQTTWSYNVVWDCDNSFLDHSRFKEGSWNDVHNNYLETYPKHLWVWYPERDENQIWGLRPGDEGFPVEIVMQAGVEPVFRSLIPDGEWYWQYEGPLENSWLENSWQILPILGGIFAIPVLIGTIYLKKIRNLLED